MCISSSSDAVALSTSEKRSAPWARAAPNTSPVLASTRRKSSCNRPSGSAYNEPSTNWLAPARRATPARTPAALSSARPRGRAVRKSAPGSPPAPRGIGPARSPACRLTAGPGSRLPRAGSPPAGRSPASAASLRAGGPGPSARGEPRRAGPPRPGPPLATGGAPGWLSPATMGRRGPQVAALHRSGSVQTATVSARRCWAVVLRWPSAPARAARSSEGV